VNPAACIGLARAADAQRIASMSRDLVEHGLGWRWKPARVLRLVHDAETNVVVARGEGGIEGFAIMRYRAENAHLLLLAVEPRCQRNGIGGALMQWLERTALVAGVGIVRLEARAGNHGARAFYRRLGYVETMRVRGMYAHDEDGVQFAKDLRAYA